MGGRLGDMWGEEVRVGRREIWKEERGWDNEFGR